MPSTLEKRNAYKREWARLHPDKVNAAEKRSRKKHAAKRKQNQHDYYITHREQIIQRNDRWRQKHPERLRAAGQARYLRNCEKMLEQHKAWRIANPERHRALNATRRARKRQAPVNDFTAQQWKDMKMAYRFRCVYCGRKMRRLTQDHITPLSKGGSHTRSNIVPACVSCNSKKHTGAPLVPVQPLLL